MQGHDVFVAENVQQGLDQLSVQPTHVLLDMNLPDGVGTTILRHIRSNNLPIKVAVVSGSLDDQLIREAESLNPDRMFTKPTDWDVLTSWVSDS